MTKAICNIYGQMSMAGERIGEVLEHLARNDIPADISLDVRAGRERCAAALDWEKRGNLVAMELYPGFVDPRCTNMNWWAYSTEECIRLIRLAQKRWREMGFTEMDSFNTYTPGNSLVAACKQTGIKYLLGFCAPTIINDGHWQITHSGSPLAPFFASAEDYRKPEAPAPENGLCIGSMELRNPITCRENWSEGPFGPLNHLMGDRTIELGALPVETIAMCEDFIRLGELTGVPRFFHVDLQYFTSPKSYDLNYSMLEWLVEQRRQGRLEFTGIREHAERMRRSGGLLPQATYWRGECMGQMVGGQPGNGHEALVVENIKGQWQFRRGSAGAERFFDYTKRWNFAPFHPKGDEPTHDGYQATVQLGGTVDRGDTRELTLRVRAPAGKTVAVWDALEGLASPFRVADCPAGITAEIVPHPGGTGGVLLLDGKKVSGTIRVSVAHSGHAANQHSRRLRDLVSIETTTIRGEPVSRLAPLVPYAMDLTVRFNGRGMIRREFINGRDFGSVEALASEPARITLDGTRSSSMARFWGATADALVFDEAELDAIQARLRVQAENDGAPRGASYLTCVSEKDCPAWIRRSASRAADADIKRVNAEVAKRHKKIVAAYHMASDLPFGTKGRVRNQFHDRRAPTKAGELFPIFYDYGQSYGPGITGWNQFLRINLGARRLARGKDYALVLHLFDPEGRNTRLRIAAHATNAEGETVEGPTIMLHEPFLVAQGISARYSPEAFVTVQLPKECTRTGAVDVGIHSHSEYLVYDRLTEGFGFVYLSHAWLVELPGGKGR
ncbi:MAG TPA: hypothetical protein PKE12_13335 [Kiritimatiellia bacterium]|nr:hypothetical protein [Kiritimatiellia bacterium]